MDIQTAADVTETEALPDRRPAMSDLSVVPDDADPQRRMYYLWDRVEGTWHGPYATSVEDELSLLQLLEEWGMAGVEA